MALFLDNEPFVAAGLAEQSTVGQVLEAARAKAASAGRLIVGLQCNQDLVPAGRLEWVLQQPAGGFGRVDFVSGRAKAVVLEALQRIQALFSETFAPLRSVSEALAAGRVGEAMRTFGDCVSVWGCAHESLVQSAGLLGLRFDELRIGGRAMAEWLAELASRLTEVKGAIEARDHVLLGDILRYEMDETLRDWEQMLAGFTAYIEQLDHD